MIVDDRMVLTEGVSLACYLAPRVPVLKGPHPPCVTPQSHTSTENSCHFNDMDKDFELDVDWGYTLEHIAISILH